MLLPSSPVLTFDEYLATDTGGLGLKRARELGPAGTIDEIARSGLRGRGGGGFPTGRKWAGVAGQPGTRRYVVANGAEGEPGTFKDRALLRANPYQLVEGVLIAGFALGATEAFVCLKASFGTELAAVNRAVAEMQAAGLSQGYRITVVAGPDEYLFGEEKALLEVIEGKAPLPRVLPPFEHGLFVSSPQMGWDAESPSPSQPGPAESNPTLVNNVETLSNVPHILARGAEWFRSRGTERSPGTIVCTVVGDVVAPDVGEVEMGTPLRAVIDGVGSGVGAGRRIKAVFSGVANTVLTAGELDVPLDYESLQAVGSGLGSAGFIVYDDTACMLEVARLFSRFLSVESCGQCSACKLGSTAITGLLDAVHSGEGTEADVAQIGSWLDKVTDGNRCYLPVEEQTVVRSILRSFPEEIVAHLEGGGCPAPRPLTLPKLVELSGGRAVYDERQARKQPDWTYAPSSPGA